MSIISPTLIMQCDGKSRIYCNTFNKFSAILDSTNPEEMDDYDLSALGLYLCKCIEQELNSSVVQLMRQYLGIDMPEFYCKRDRNFRGRCGVNTARYGAPDHWVYLNGYIDRNRLDSLQMISMGEAHNALMALTEMCPVWFAHYPVTTDPRFLELWRDISRLRNEMAHPGIILKRNALESFYKKCSEFLTIYMPELVRIKEELAPDDWVENDRIEIEVPKKKINARSVEELMAEFKPSGKPKATQEEYRKLMELREQYKNVSDFSSQESMDLGNKVCSFEDSYDWFETLFIKNGKVGVKDLLGNIVIPARYDEIEELHNTVSPVYSSTVVKAEGKFGLVERYSGKELAYCIYDQLYNPYEFWQYLFFKKNGTDCYGIVRRDGKEVVPCIIDEMNDIKQDRQNLIFRSGEKYGLYSFYYDVYYEPIFDHITQGVNDYDPYIFTVDGNDGYMSNSGKFISIKDFKLQQDPYSKDYINETDLISDFDDDMEG